jgi:hypothetical protein
MYSPKTIPEERADLERTRRPNLSTREYQEYERMRDGLIHATLIVTDSDAELARAHSLADPVTVGRRKLRFLNARVISAI